MAGSINPEMKDFIEEWESVTPTTQFIIRLDHRGDYVQEGVQGAQKFKISTYERLITQDKIRVKDLDPFTNGCFRPLVVPEDVTVETNPNAISDDEIDRILVSSQLAWDEYMKVLNAPTTLRRMLDRAEASDCSHKRYRQLEERLAEVDTKRVTRIVSSDPELNDDLKPARGRPRKAAATGSTNSSN